MGLADPSAIAGMRIGILEAGRPDADLLAPHGDYPAMIERFLGAHDPTFRFSAFAAFEGELPRAAGDRISS